MRSGIARGVGGGEAGQDSSPGQICDGIVTPVTVFAFAYRSLGTEGEEIGMQKSESNSKSPSELIDARIEELGDWRGKMLSRLRTLLKEADPEVVEEWKWRGVPVWSHDGLICTGETYKNVVKVTFAKGAALKDPSGLFNSSRDGNTRRAIDFREGEKIDEEALKALVRAAVTLNKSTVGRARNK
jgi:hypothetical protein